MAKRLFVLSAGAFSPVGAEAAPTCAAVRAGIMAFGSTNFLSDDPDFAPIIGASVVSRPEPGDEPDFDRLVAMASGAVRECLENAEGIDPARTALILGLREPYRVHPGLGASQEEWISAVTASTGAKFHPGSCVFFDGHAAGIHGLHRGRRLLDAGRVDACVVGGVDSLLNGYDLDRLQRNYRLKNARVPQGLIPGECAAFVAVTTQERWNRSLSGPAVLGIGLAEEDPQHSLVGDGYPTGKGLRAALEAASRDAGITEDRITLRVSDLNGEYYRGIDSMLALTRFYRTHREQLPIWHPADCIGDTGAACGVLLVMVATRAIGMGYAPAGLAMCEASSDTGMRACCVVGGAVTPPRVRRTDGDHARRRRSGVGMSGHAPWNADVRIEARDRTTHGVATGIVEQHAAEAAFLWSLRDVAARMPHFSLRDLAELDDRVEAHLDGLRVAGEPGWDFARVGLEGGGPGEIFAATIAALLSDRPERATEVLEAILAQPTALRGMVSALGWLPLDEALPRISELLAATESTHRLVAVGAMAVHRHDAGLAFDAAFNDSSAAVRARAFRAAGELGRVDLAPSLERVLDDPDPACRFAGAWATALLTESPRAVAALRSIAEAGKEFSEDAARLAARRMATESVRDWRAALTSRSPGSRIALVAAGEAGDPRAIPWLIERMGDPSSARIAGEAFSLITGADIEAEKLDRLAPPDFEAGPSEEPADADVAMDPDEHLPWPHASKVERWWASQERRFRAGERYLLGHPLVEAALKKALREARQRQRRAAALELTIQNPGQPLFEVRAPGFRQQAALRA